MKKIVFILSIFLFSAFLYSQIPPSNIEEIKKSLKEIESAIKSGNEDLVEVFTEAIEIEKRATTSYLAEAIAERIGKETSLSKADFKKLREKFSFFDIAIGYGLSQSVNVSIKNIMKEKEGKSWKEIFEGYCVDKNSTISAIKKINPPK